MSIFNAYSILRLINLVVLFLIINSQISAKQLVLHDTCSSKLFEAVKINDLRGIQKLVSQGCDLNNTNRSGDTPFRQAIYYCDINTLEFMVENGADPNLASSRFSSPTHYAAGMATDKFRLLLDFGGEINTFNYRNFPTPLIWAIEENQIENIRIMLENGVVVDPDSSNNFNSALAFAISKGRFEVIDMFIEFGANLDITFSEGHSGDCFCCPSEITLLHKIVYTYSYSDDKDSLSYLLVRFIKGGAHINKTNGQGLTPIDFAAYLNIPSLVEILIEYGANMNNSLHNASRLSNYETVKILLEKGSDPNLLDSYGETALISCITCCGDGMGAGIKIENRVKTIELLVDSGADPKIKDNHGKSFLDYCNLKSRSDIKKMLINHGYITQ